jgi:hypothetical protein
MLDLDAPIIEWVPEFRLAEWRVIGLTASHVVYVQASSAEEHWDFPSRTQEWEVSGWLRGRSTVTSVGITQLSTFHTDVSSLWSWNTAWEIGFEDGTSVRLPLFGGLPKRDQADQVKAIVDALRLGLT